jgi:hypothetical protein
MLAQNVCQLSTTKRTAVPPERARGQRLLAWHRLLDPEWQVQGLACHVFARMMHQASSHKRIIGSSVGCVGV